MALGMIVALVLAAILAGGVWAIQGLLERIANRLETRDEKPDGVSPKQFDELVKAVWALQSLSERPVEPSPGYDVGEQRRLRNSRRDLRGAIENALSQMLFAPAAATEENLHAFMQLDGKARGLFGPKVVEDVELLAQGLVTLVHSGPADSDRLREFLWHSWQQTRQAMLKEIEADNDVARGSS